MILRQIKEFEIVGGLLDGAFLYDLTFDTFYINEPLKRVAVVNPNGDVSRGESLQFCFDDKKGRYGKYKKVYLPTEDGGEGYYWEWVGYE